MKKTGIILLIIALLILGVACNNETQAPNTDMDLEDDAIIDVEDKLVKVAALNGPTGMGMVKLMEDNHNKKSLLDYEFNLMASPDDLVGKIVNGEVDIAAVPSNLALVLYNNTEGQVQLAAVNTLGVSYLLENGNKIENVKDLEGKTINVSGKGAIPDFAIQYILEKNNLKIDKDVKIDFSLQHGELAAAMAEGDIEIGLLPQPHVTTAMMKNDDLRIALDITEEWKAVNTDNSELAMGVIIVQREFAENNKEMLDIFLEEYRQSVNFVNEEIDKSAALIEEYEILPNAAIAKQALPYSNIVYIDAQEGKEFLEELYEILYSFEPKSIGGKLADEDFYYKK